MFNIKPIALSWRYSSVRSWFFTFYTFINRAYLSNRILAVLCCSYSFIFIVGGSLVITNRNVELKISIKEAFIITVLSWVLMAILCAIPFIYTQLKLSVVMQFLSL